MPVEHRNPRGTWPADCEQCGTHGACVLRIVGDRYLWVCVDGCPHTYTEADVVNAVSGLTYDDLEAK